MDHQDFSILPQDAIPIPMASWEGTFRLFGVNVKCYVVDGQRIIDAESMARLLTAMADGTMDVGDNLDVEAFAKWQQFGPTV